jgi:hypothetical protein
VCVGDFDTPGQLTVEHVPGRAVGGKPMVLTCGPCNHGAGHRLDAHVATADRLRRHKAGMADLRGLRGAFEVEGKQPVNARFTLTADTVAPTIDYRQNDPEAWRSLLEHMQQLAPDATLNGRMTIFPPRTDNAAAKAGWLRAAYLCAFAAFGYRYLLDSALAPVRQQIEHPGGDLAGFGVNNADAVDRPQLVVIRRPLELRAVLVRCEMSQCSCPGPATWTSTSGSTERPMRAGGRTSRAS